MSLRDIFSNSIAFKVINKYDKGAVVQIAAVLRSLTAFLVEVSSQARVFRHLFLQVFRSSQFLKKITYDGHLFIENVQNLIGLSKMQKQIENIFFVS